MVTVTITDTGRRRVGDSVNELDIVNSGVPITIYAQTVTVDLNKNSNNKPEISNYRTVAGDSTTQAQQRQYTYSEVDVTSIECPKWTVKGVLDSRESTHMIMLGQLIRLVKTKGYKVFTTDMASYSEYEEESGTIVGINVRTKSLNVEHSESSKFLKYTLTMEQTK